MHTHAVQFYEDDDYLCRTVATFLSGGLQSGAPGVIIATAPHRQLVSAHLRASSIDVSAAIHDGSLIMLDAKETLDQFMVGGLPDEDRFNQVIGEVLDKASRSRPGALLHAYGEMVDVLWKANNPEAVLRLEELWNDLQRERQFSLLCAYLMGNFLRASDATRFRALCATHSHVMPTEAFNGHGEREAQLREIAQLQQRAVALENEIMERARAEEAVRQASRAKDEFLAMLGHELRNPLAPIVTALQVMKLKGDEASTREQQVIERQVDHMVRLIDDLLDVSRITNGHIQLRKKPFELSVAVARAVEMAAPLIEQRQHQLTVNVARTGLKLEADMARIAQVIANLLTNAARYTMPGGHITLSAERSGRELVVSTRDDGIGIKPDLLPRIFDLFVQGQRSPDRSEGGLGIGLSLVRSLVLLHQGSVHVASDGPGKGSEFTFRLPALPEDMPHPARATNTPVPLGPAKRPRRILIVDDNVDAAELLAELLRSVGHEVVVAHDGAQALAAVGAFAAELAFLDIGLPAMDGYELASRLRAEHDHTMRLIALTGYGQDQDRARSAAAGFEAHLVKPVSPAHFLATIERN
jgi:signal transduction histidine kinase